MIDFATLTGACVYSLTERMSGVFTNRPALVPKLLSRPARSSGERVWNFPFDADYRLRSREQGRRHRAVRRRRQGRSHPRDALPQPLRSGRDSRGRTWICLAATRSGGLGHINTDITGFGVRYALELLLKQDVLERTAERRRA